MVNTPVAVFDAYVYADQPDGGFGTEAMNGPATWFWPLVTWVVRAVRPAAPLGGTTPMWRRRSKRPTRARGRRPGPSRCEPAAARWRTAGRAAERGSR